MKFIWFIIILQLSDVQKWSHRNLQYWQKKKADLCLWTVTLKSMRVIMSAGINRFQTQLLSLCWDTFTLTALLINMEMVFPPAASHLKLRQILTISWSSVMWMWMILQCITVAHGTSLLMRGYHSDSQHDKNLLTAHIHFCFNTRRMVLNSIRTVFTVVPWIMIAYNSRCHDSIYLNHTHMTGSL